MASRLDGSVEILGGDDPEAGGGVLAAHAETTAAVRTSKANRGLPLPRISPSIRPEHKKAIDRLDHLLSTAPARSHASLVSIKKARRQLFEIVACPAFHRCPQQPVFELPIEPRPGRRVLRALSRSQVRQAAGTPEPFGGSAQDVCGLLARRALERRAPAPTCPAASDPNTDSKRNVAVTEDQNIYLARAGIDAGSNVR